MVSDARLVERLDRLHPQVSSGSFEATKNGNWSGQQLCVFTLLPVSACFTSGARASIGYVRLLSHVSYTWTTQNLHSHSNTRTKGFQISHSPNRRTFDLALLKSASTSLSCASTLFTRSTSWRAACRYGAISSSTALAIRSNSCPMSFRIASSISAANFSDDRRTFFLTSPRFWGSVRIPAYLPKQLKRQLLHVSASPPKAHKSVRQSQP